MGADTWRKGGWLGRPQVDGEIPASQPSVTAPAPSRAPTDIAAQDYTPTPAPHFESEGDAEARAYIPSARVPRERQFKTFDRLKVRIAPHLDPRQVPTQPRVSSRPPPPPGGAVADSLSPQAAGAREASRAAPREGFTLLLLGLGAACFGILAAGGLRKLEQAEAASASRPLKAVQLAPPPSHWSERARFGQNQAGPGIRERIVEMNVFIPAPKSASLGKTRALHVTRPAGSVARERAPSGGEEHTTAAEPTPVVSARTTRPFN